MSPKSAAPVQGDAGFTLVEVMVAGTMAVLLALPAYALLAATYRFADKVQSRFHLNEQARQVLTLLGDGSAQFGLVNNARGFRLVEGLRSRPAIPTNWPLRIAGQFTMTDTNSLFLSGDGVPSLSIQCSAATVPIPDCTGTETRTLAGWMGSDPTLVLASPKTVSVGVSVVDPFRAQRMVKTPASVTESYRTIFSLNVEANP